MSVIDKIYSSIRSKYKGDEVVLKLADEIEAKYLPINLLGLEYVIGRPGLPHGKFIQVAGFEDSGKSLLCQHFLIQFQINYPEGVAVLIDTENSFDNSFFEKLGGNLKSLLVTKPKSLEKVFEFIQFDLVESVKRVSQELKKEVPIFVVIDSLSIGTEKEILDLSSEVGLHARFLSKVFRVMRHNLPSWNATIVFVSQNKEKISTRTFGGGITRLGGHAVEFTAILTIEMKRVKEVYDSKNQLEGIFFKAKATKNHVSLPFKECDLYFDVKKWKFHNGFTLFTYALSKGMLKQGKGWYEYKGKNYRERELYDMLESDLDLVIEFRKEYDLELKEELIYKAE